MADMLINFRRLLKEMKIYLKALLLRFFDALRENLGKETLLHFMSFINMVLVPFQIQSEANTGAETRRRYWKIFRARKILVGKEITVEC